MIPKAELLFPATLIPQLRDLRGSEWRDLVDTVSCLPETHPDSLAFSLLLIRLDGCLKCFAGSYKFMRGCPLCATQTVTQFKGPDEELVHMYRRAQQEIDEYLITNRPLAAAA